MAELGWGFISRRRMGACCQLPRHHKVCDTKTLTAGLTAPRKGGERNTSANFERTIQTLTMFLLGTGGSPPPAAPGLSAVPEYTGDREGFRLFWGRGSSSSAKLLVRDREHHVQQISEDLGLLYNGKAFLGHIRKVQESTQTWFGLDMSYYPPTPGQCNCSTC